MTAIFKQCDAKREDEGSSSFLIYEYKKSADEIFVGSLLLL